METEFIYNEKTLAINVERDVSYIVGGVISFAPES